MEPGALVRASRLRHGLSQASLARRAGTSQAAVSRIERGLEAPTHARLAQLLLALGERPVLGSEPLAPRPDPAELAAALRLSPTERLREAASWNLVTARLELAGVEARGR